MFLGESLEFVPDPSGEGWVYRFRIHRVYKGLDNTLSEVLLNPENFTSCNFRYLIGKRYLVFADIMMQKPLVLIAGSCSGSRIASDHRSDVDFLERYIRGATETEVNGKVLQWVTWIGLPKEVESAPLGGVAIWLERPNQRFTTVSQPDGSFRFTGIPPGQYQLSAKLDPYLPDPAIYQVSVEKGGCNEVFVQLKAQSGIEGTLYKSDGEPAANTRVELLRKQHSGKWYYTFKMWAQTNENGQFRFEDIESGEYLLGYEIWSKYPADHSPYPTHYYPGVSDLTQAEVITILPQQTLRNLSLTLPQPQAERKITIKVIGLDGKPPGTNRLQVSTKSGFIKNLEGNDHGGVVVFTGYQQRGYEINAQYWIEQLGVDGRVTGRKIIKSDTIKVNSGEKDIEIVVVLRHEINIEKDQ